MKGNENGITQGMTVRFRSRDHESANDDNLYNLKRKQSFSN